MRSILFLAGLLINLACFAQTAITLGGAKQINENEVMVYPNWGAKNGKGDSKPVLPSEIEEWITKYNKENRTDYVLNFQCITVKSYVLITRAQKAKEDADANSYTPVLPAALTDRAPTVIFTEPLSYDTKRTYLELILKPNKKCKVPLSPGVNYKNIFDIPTHAAYAKAAVGKNEWANGKNLIQYYKDEGDSYPSYYYLGELKNGSPHGYGFFARMDRNTGIVAIRCGKWENGQFLDEQTARIFADSMLSKTVKEIDLSNIKYNFKEIVYETDPLNPKLTNGFINLFTATWGDSVKPHYLYLSFSANDFYSYPRLNLISTGGSTHINYANRERTTVAPPTFADMLVGALTRKFAGYTYALDDYTQVTEGSSYKCNPRLLRTETSVTYNYTTGMTSGETMRTENRTETPVYGYDDCRSYTIRIRDSRGSDDWRTVASFSTTQFLDGNGRGNTNSVQVNDYDDNSIAQEYYSHKDALNAVVKAIREKNPYPKNDMAVVKKVKKAGEEVNENKLDFLFSRINSSPLYQFNPSDSLAGAWYDSENKKIYFIQGSDKREWLTLNTDETVINEFDAYQRKLVKIFGAYSDNEIRITTNKDGQIIRSEMQITELNKRFIRFDNGLVWKRI